MPSSRSATHRAGHGSNRRAASTAKTGTASVLEPRSWRAPVTSTISLAAGISAAAAAQFVDRPERVGCAVREHRRQLDERQMLGASLPRQKRCPVQRSPCGTPRIFSGVRTVLRGAIRSEEQWADWTKRPATLAPVPTTNTDSHSRWISYRGPPTFLLIVVLVQARVAKSRRR